MRRIKVFNGLLLANAVVFFLYIFYIQCLRFSHYQRIAKLEHEKMMVICGARGNIYDRNGLPLATSQPCYTVFCTPRYATSKNILARGITRISGRSLETVKCQVEEGRFFWVDKKVSLDRRDLYLNLNDPSIGFTYDLNRQYNMPEIFGSLLGKCGTDNKGLEGLELQLDQYLTGRSGFVIYQKDPTGEIFPYHNYPEREPKPGQDVYLTIDLQLQAILYSNLKDYLVKEEAKSASGLIVDPATGEILALVNIGRDNDERDHALCDEFEPGSTFKLVTLTYGLMNGHRENEIINTEGGKIKISGYTINDFKNYGVITLRQAVAHSSNVAMVKMSRDFDRDKFYLLVRDFGFTQPTGIELPGEVRGLLPDVERMNELEFATLSFGQGLTCSLLQLAFAYQAVANRGVLNKPYLVREIRQGAKVSFQAKPLRVRRVLDEDLAAKISNILCSVVDEGSGTEAKVEGVRIAGKTGTAQKVVGGHYSNTAIITTFIGYFPADAPQYLVAIMLDEPKKGMWASAIAAPVFKRVAQSICQMNLSRYAVK
jgi:cell division protein FtsI (penicillin-binding protein 3)